MQPSVYSGTQRGLIEKRAIILFINLSTRVPNPSASCLVFPIALPNVCSHVTYHLARFPLPLVPNPPLRPPLCSPLHHAPSHPLLAPLCHPLLPVDLPSPPS